MGGWSRVVGNSESVDREWKVWKGSPAWRAEKLSWMVLDSDRCRKRGEVGGVMRLLTKVGRSAPAVTEGVACEIGGWQGLRQASLAHDAGTLTVAAYRESVDAAWPLRAGPPVLRQLVCRLRSLMQARELITARPFPLMGKRWPLCCL